METNHAAFPQWTALGLDISLRITVDENPRRLLFVEVELVGEF
jgi:hypothetical protein